MDAGSARHESSDDDEQQAQRRNVQIAPGLIALWIGDKLQCVPVADLPAPVHESCFEGCPACCPPARGF